MDFNLRFSMSKFHLFQRDELETSAIGNYFDESRPAYLYCILARNRTAINIHVISFDDKFIGIEFEIKNRSEIIREKIKLANQWNNLKELKIISDFPHSEFCISDELGSTLFKGKAGYFMEHELIYPQIKNKEMLDYEILYIGHSISSKDTIPSFHRTSKAHHKYQKILEDYNRKNPDKELYLVLFSMKEDALLEILEPLAEKERLEFVEKFKSVYLHLADRKEIMKEQVCLFEAGLVYYFKPEYNNKLKNIPPNKSHVSYSSTMNLNLRKMNILFGLNNFNPRLYSAANKKSDTYRMEFHIR